MAELTVIRGDSKSYNVAFADDNGAAVDITGATVFLTVKRNLSDSDSDAIISKTVTSHTNPTGGLTSIELTTTDTNNAAGIYYYDLQLKKADGSILSIEPDKFIIVYDVTRRTS